MKLNFSRILFTSTLLASTSVALALPFNSFDPRSMAMGGAGVAAGDSSTAPFFNPALLTFTHEDDLFSLDFPIVGARVYDPDDFETGLDDFQNGDYVTTLNDAITAYNPGTVTTALDALDALDAQLASLGGKPIQAEAGAGLVIGVPGKSFGGAFYANGWGVIGGEIKYNDSANLTAFSNAPTVASGCVLPCADLNAYQYTPAGGVPQNFINSINGMINYSPDDDLLSKVNIRGVVLTEIGFAMSREFNLMGSDLGIGITPKVVRATLFDYTADVDSGDTGNTTDGDYTAKYTSVNFDLGLTKDYANGWRTGFVVKDILPRSYDFKSIAPGATPGSAQVVTGTMKLKAQARVGVSHSNDWSTVALDVDLTHNDPAGLEDSSQYVALGAELDAWGWAQLRLGYRADMKNSDRNVASVGVGISPLGVVHIDSAASGNANEIGASARLAFTF